MSPVKIIDREIFDRRRGFLPRADFHGTANRETIFRPRRTSRSRAFPALRVHVQVHAVIKGALGDGAFFEVGDVFKCFLFLSSYASR